LREVKKPGLFSDVWLDTKAFSSSAVSFFWVGGATEETARAGVLAETGPLSWAGAVTDLLLPFSPHSRDPRVKQISIQLQRFCLNLFLKEAPGLGLPFARP
jgi:hypothetical protein